MIPDKLEDLPQDKTLTPDSAKEFGYKWILDISTLLTSDLQSEFCRLVMEKGFKLGKAKCYWDEHDRGFYQPLDDRKTQQENT